MKGQITQELPHERREWEPHSTLNAMFRKGILSIPSRASFGSSFGLGALMVMVLVELCRSHQWIVEVEVAEAPVCYDPEWATLSLSSSSNCTYNCESIAIVIEDLVERRTTLLGALTANSGALHGWIGSKDSLGSSGHPLQLSVVASS